MPTQPGDLDELIDAGEVAALLGLAHRNSVSTYRSRYEDFPAGHPAPYRGRGRLWVRGEIVAWAAQFHATRDGGGDDHDERLDALVAATRRLLLAHPGHEISIREIAAEAGVAHSDLYRHAASKERLIDLAVTDIEASIRDSLPPTLDLLPENLPRIIGSVLDARAALLVIMDRAAHGGSLTSNQTLAVNALADLLTADRATRGSTSTVDPHLLAAAIGSVIWGLFVLEDRWRESLGIGELDTHQVSAIVQAMLDS